MNSAVSNTGRGQSADAAERSGIYRERFPVLQREVHGQPLVYLDSAATAQKPAEVIEAQARYYQQSNANVHRGMHTLASEATSAYEDCRTEVARWLAAPQTDSVVITRSATAALNLVARGWEHRLRPGDEILLTEMEHHANLVPWLMLAERSGVRIRYIPLTAEGELDLQNLRRLLNERTRIVSLTHVSNVLGTINPVREIAAAARRIGALVVLDAAQSVGRMPVSFADLNVDLLTFSAHKVYGPMGLGFLIGRDEVLAELQPMEGGGEMIEVVQFDRVSWAEVPFKFEAGTPNVGSAVGFPPAIAMLESIGMDQVRSHEQDLLAYASERLDEFKGLIRYGPADIQRRAGLISFSDPLVHPHDMATVLDQKGVAVRAGHHCAQPLHRRLGVVATTRASLGIYNGRDDIDALIDGMQFARKVFGS